VSKSWILFTIKVIIENLLWNLSKPCDIVLDPMAGSEASDPSAFSGFLAVCILVVHSLKFLELFFFLCFLFLYERFDTDHTFNLLIMYTL
jgi:hypothetical protein